MPRLWPSSRRWRWLLSVMTGGRCHRLKKMMGRGPDGGCGTDERPCRAISRVPASQTEAPPTAEKKLKSVEVDFFSQARKALCERSPFDVPEDGSGAGTSGGSAVSTTLPSGLASLLRQSEGRKRHKKSHSAADKKSSRGSERSKGGNIWLETEEHFRDLEVSDIDSLFDVTSSLNFLAASRCFLVPYVGNEQDGIGNEQNETAETGARADDECSNAGANLNSDSGNENVNMVMAKDEGKQANEHFMEIDSVEAQTDGTDGLSHEEGKVSASSDSPSGVEWLLACKNRALLTSERPSKKRKLLGSAAGLEKILVGSPCEGSSLCDFCCKGEIGLDKNPLIVCSSCKVAVHGRCYGVQGVVDDCWLCSWCKQRVDGNDLAKQRCVLCPKQGGALKPLSVENGISSVEFVHLFCAQWMPEVYVEDVMKMEPIMNIGEIKETRRKLVCNICKVKCGACVRCSHGTCRTAFHPICAREARHRMEVWGKYGCDNVELRAFCTKHSEFPEGRNGSLLGDTVVAASNDSSATNLKKQQKTKIGRIEDKIALQQETCETNSAISGDSEMQGNVDISDSKVNDTLEHGDVDKSCKLEMFEKSDNEDSNPSDSLNFVLVLKKLIDRGKVNTKDVATEIGVSPDSLISRLGEDNLVPDLRCKIMKWLRKHAYMGTLHKNMKVKLKSTVLSKAEMERSDHSDGEKMPVSDISDPVAVKSVPPRRRTTNNIRILRDNKSFCSSDKNNGVMMVKVEEMANEALGNPCKISADDSNEKGSNASDGIQAPLGAHLLQSESNPDTEKTERMPAVAGEQSNLVTTESGSSVHSNLNLVLPDLKKTESSSSFYVHPSVHKRLLQMQTGLCKNEIDVCIEEERSHVDSSSASVSCSNEDEHSKCNDKTCQLDGVNSDQLVKAKKLCVLNLSPADEVEGEIIYFQNRLLDNAVARKRFTDNLICKVAHCLPGEIDSARERKWDAVLVNQYLCDLREAKKQGRKERKHKEAQAVLAAATAAAAASSRSSSLRKDAFDEALHQEKYNASNGRVLISSQLMPRAKETLSRIAAPKNSLDKYTDIVLSDSDFSKDPVRSCDICRRPESILNPILVCFSCKVSVHLDCYRSVKESMGPWYCELCEELQSSKGSGAPSVNFWDKPCSVAACGVCGGASGAFRKTTDGQWVHAFCAEWVFEPAFRRGQVNPVEGMERVEKGTNVCCVCGRQFGVCVKCSYGHCHATFHPSCARSAGFYMNIKTISGRMQHKAYCGKHSLEQRVKAETQKHGVKEINNLKQVRVELERLRLLCERIIKREKIKRDLVFCSHSILACKREQVARSVLVQSPFFPHAVSSESATTSLKGNNTDEYKSCRDAIQRSDDVTVDSTISVKPRIKVTMSTETDRKTDDSSTSQNPVNLKPSERMAFGGKKIPQRSSLASLNPPDDGEWSSRSRKQFETFEKELIMTSDQASMKNQQLPKGYFYVPVDCLPKEKQINQDLQSDELSEAKR